MSEDQVEIWKALKESSKERRAENRDHGAKALEDAGIAFRSNNGGLHLMVDFAGRRADYWPGTGKWIVKEKGKRPRMQNRGVRSLIAFIKSEEQRS